GLAGKKQPLQATPLQRFGIGHEPRILWACNVVTARFAISARARASTHARSAPSVPRAPAHGVQIDFRGNYDPGFSCKLHPGFSCKLRRGFSGDFRVLTGGASDRFSRGVNNCRGIFYYPEPTAGPHYFRKSRLMRFWQDASLVVPRTLRTAHGL